VSIEKNVVLRFNGILHPENGDKIIALQRNINLDDRNAWPEYCDWLVNMNDKFLRALDLGVKKLKFAEENQEASFSQFSFANAIYHAAKTMNPLAQRVHYHFFDFHRVEQ